jgi:hypothetical protein
MKATILNLWPAVFVTLGLAMGNGQRPPQVKKLYRFQTEKGPFYIVEFKSRFYPMFNDELLGSYGTPEAVAADLFFARAFIIPGVDLPSLGIPASLKKWERL